MLVFDVPVVSSTKPGRVLAFLQLIPNESWEFADHKTCGIALCKADRLAASSMRLIVYCLAGHAR